MLIISRSIGEKMLISVFFLTSSSCWSVSYAEQSSCEIRDHLIIAGSGFRPLFNIEPSVKDGLPTGVDMDIIRILAQKLNLSLSFKLSETWGIKRNGQWSGTVGEVYNGSADIGIGHLSLNPQRLRDVDFTTPLYDSNIYLATRRPKALPQHFNILKPFTVWSWFAIGLTIFLCLILRYCLLHVLGKSEKPHRNFMRAMFLLASALDQSVPDLRVNRRHSSFVMTFAWLFFSTIILMAYECNLRAYLVSVDFEPAVNTAKDLVKYNRPLYVDRGAMIVTTLKESSDQVFRAIYKKIVDNEQYFKSQAGLPLSMELKMKNEGAVILFTKKMFEARLNEVKERYGSQILQIGNSPFWVGFSGFVVQKRSCLKSTLDSRLRHLIQNGIVAQLMDRNLPVQMNPDKSESSHDEEVLNIDHLLLANIFFCFGIACSCMTFLVETRLYIPLKI